MKKIMDKSHHLVYEYQNLFELLQILYMLQDTLQKDSYSYYKVLKGLVKLNDGTYIAPKEYLKMVQ